MGTVLGTTYYCAILQYESFVAEHLCTSAVETRNFLVSVMEARG